LKEIKNIIEKVKLMYDEAYKDKNLSDKDSRSN
jgi:hypothetical protein